MGVPHYAAIALLEKFRRVVRARICSTSREERDAAYSHGLIWQCWKMAEMIQKNFSRIWAWICQCDVPLTAYLSKSFMPLQAQGPAMAFVKLGWT